MPKKPSYEELERENIELKQKNDSLNRYYRSVVDNSMDAMLLTAPGGDVFFANQAACDLFQMTEQEIIDGGRMALLDEEDDRLPKALEEREITGKFVGELNCKKKDGTIFPGEISSSIFKDTEGQPLTSLIIRDVTERTKMEDALRDSEEKYRKLYEDAAIGIFHSTFDGRFLDVNPALVKMLGYETPQEVLNSIYSIAEQIYVEPQTRDKVVVQSLAKGETVKVENLYRRKDGSEWIAYLHLRYVSDVNGQPIALEGFVEDITERRQAEMKLAENERNMSTILNNTHDIVVRIDRDYKHIFANSALYTATGLTPEQYLGKTNEEIGMPEHLSALWRKKHQEVFATGNPVYFEFSYSTIESGERTFQAAVCPEFNDNSEVETIVSFIRDITEMKLVESEKDAAIDKLEKALAKIKTLRGLLPICSHCKKIRDDKGYWNQIEAYIHEHSEAEFSHGICPECVRELYPDINIYDD